MSKEYTVTKISQDDPREWDGPHGKVYYVKVKLEGVERAVEIGKKDPMALKEGSTVYGEIIPQDGRPTDRFKSDNPNFAQGSTRSGAYKPTYQPRDDDRIVAQWAIGQATQLLICVYGKDVLSSDSPEQDFQLIESTAKRYYAMVDQVKGGVKAQKVDPNQTSIETQPSLKDNWDKIRGEDEEEAIDLKEEQVDLSEIPF